MARPSHPDDQSLSAYGLGKIGIPEVTQIQHHVAGCRDCQRRVAELSADSFLDQIRGAVRNPGSTLPPGTSIVDAPVATPGLPDADVPPELAAHPQYSQIRKLGAGGMGVVYVAKNILMDRWEVLKVLNRALLEKAGAAERFLREIRSAAKLQHANVVGAYSALQVGPLLVFAMEYVEGDDFAAIIKTQGPLPVPYACLYAYQAAQGLQHAHDRGMVHRDIKPGNLILTRVNKKSTVKILDFGLAKATSEKGMESDLTGAGRMLGTPDYMAPEQSRDATKADIRADIYSLGCTLYAMLAARPPFQADSLYALFEAHAKTDAPMLNLVRPEVPVELATVVAKMMAKLPAKRYQTPQEVAKALGDFIKPGNVTKPPMVVAAPPVPPPVTKPTPVAKPTPAPPAVREPLPPVEQAAPPVLAPKTPPPPVAPIAAMPAWVQTVMEAVPVELPPAAAMPVVLPITEPAASLKFDADVAPPKTDPLPAKPRRSALPWLLPLLGIALLIGIGYALKESGAFARKPKPVAPETRLVLVVSPDDAAVMIDSTPSDWITKLPFGSQITPGEHSIVVHKTGYETKTEKIKIIEGENRSVYIYLDTKTTAELKDATDNDTSRQKEPQIAKMKPKPVLETAPSPRFWDPRQSLPSSIPAVNSRTELSGFAKHSDPIRNVVMQPDGVTAVSASYSNDPKVPATSLRCWNVIGGKELWSQQIAGKSKDYGIHKLIASQRGSNLLISRICSRSVDKYKKDINQYCVELRNGLDGELIYAFKHDMNSVADLAFSAKDDVAIAIDNSGHIWKWSTVTGRLLESHPPQQPNADRSLLTLDTNGQFIYSLDNRGVTKISADAVQNTATIDRDIYSYGRVFLASPVGDNYLVSSRRERTFEVMDFKKGLRAELDYEGETITCLRYTHTGDCVLAATLQGEVFCWSIPKECVVFRFRAYSNAIHTISASASDRVVVVGGDDKIAKTYGTAPE